MLTAMLAAKNILGASYDIWNVNVDQEYHEEMGSNRDDDSEQWAMLAATQPKVPQRKQKVA